jgi:hypothetical protein
MVGCTLGVVLVLAPLTGCVETRVIHNRPMLAGLPGSNTGMEITGPRNAPPPTSLMEPAIAADGSRRLVTEDRDGNRTLHIRSGNDLIYHITWTLEENERALFTQQVLSRMTKSEFAARGVDAGTAFDELKRRERELRVLFARMPVGEFTPGMVMKPVGDHVYRLQVKPGPKLYYSGMDMVSEGGMWRLRWFVR